MFSYAVGMLASAVVCLLACYRCKRRADRENALLRETLRVRALHIEREAEADRKIMRMGEDSLLEAQPRFKIGGPSDN